MRLRSGHWSAGAARVATRLGLQAKSFDLAAEVFGDAVGRSISADSLASLTQDRGQRIGAQQTTEATPANQPAQRGERSDQPRSPEVAALSGQANLATDGAMLLVQGEGWKEVKVVAVSAVAVQSANARQADPASHRAGDPLVTLSQHSYQAGLWDADTLAPYQLLKA